jgi:hypothetical protein
MKRLLAAFVLLAAMLVLGVGTTGCTKKEPTKDLDKKADGSKEMKPSSPDASKSDGKKKDDLDFDTPKK